MIEIMAGSTLLGISLFLAIINWKIYKVTVEMLKVTVDIHYRTLDLLKCTQKTYQILGGEDGLTIADASAKVIQTKNSNH